MFGQIGPLEIALVLIIALIVFGPKRLPELGNEFRDGISNLGHNDDDEDDDDEPAEPAELTAGEAPDPDDPAVHEITDAERAKVAEDDAETVDAEVVTERHD